LLDIFSMTWYAISMVFELEQDLLTAPVEAIGHFCNCQCVWGAGLALKMKQKYPEAYIADCKTQKGDITKLGTFSYTKSNDGNRYIFNCYTQFRYGREQRHTNYEAVYNSLDGVNKFLQENNVKSLGLPKNAGCRLGGASWTVVRAIIEDIFISSPVELYICHYEP
jgi:O-acetyl-ADP-ribose deacetylase (regulator of RNase III)